MRPPHTVLHLIRHGQSTWNLAGRVQGQSSQAGTLTTAGRAEAGHTGRLLAQQHPRAERILTSDLGRARETAEIIAGLLGLPVEHDAELREQRLGHLEGRRLTDLLEVGTVQDALEQLWQHPRRRPPGGESVADMYFRVHRALVCHAVHRPGRELILVTHGGPIRVATTTADRRLDAPIPRRPVANASITTLMRSRPPGVACR